MCVYIYIYIYSIISEPNGAWLHAHTGNGSRSFAAQTTDAYITCITCLGRTAGSCRPCTTELKCV